MSEESPKYVNPHDLVGDKQLVFWNEWREGDTLEFELIDYFRAMPYRKSRGLYIIYWARAASDYLPLGIKAGNELVIFISYRAYNYALQKLPAELKVPCLRKYAEGKNLYIRIERENSERIKVHHQELREPSSDDVERSEGEYKLIESEHGRRR